MSADPQTSSQTDTAVRGREQRDRSPRTLLVAAGSGVVVAALAGGLLFGVTHGGRNVDPSSSPTAGRATATFAPDVTWAPVVGVKLPSSRLNGPRTTSAGTARGFTQSETGAALAAVHILIRTGANVGPLIYGPTIATQVTGANVPAMKAVTDQTYQQLRSTGTVSDGTPAAAGDAVVLGYKVVAYNPQHGPTTIQVFLTAPALRATDRAVRFDVQLVWWHEDWRVVAPPRGDWGAAATSVGPDRPGLITYDVGH